MNNSVGKLHQSAFFFPLGRAFITEVCVPSIVKIVTGIFEMSTYRAKEHTRAREHTHTCRDGEAIKGSKKKKGADGQTDGQPDRKAGREAGFQTG